MDMDMDEEMAVAAPLQSLPPLLLAEMSPDY
jgi:hypothetical protein